MKKGGLIFILFQLIITLPVYGVFDFDSLKKQLNEAQDDSSQVILYTELATFYSQNKKPDSVIFYADKAIDIAMESGNKYLIAYAQESKGRFQREHGNHLNSLELLFNAKEIFQESNHKYELGRVFNEIALNYHHLGESEKAMKGYQSALMIFNELKDKEKIAHCYNNLGNLHYEQDNFENALRYYKQALSYYKSNQNTLMVAQTKNNIARIFLAQDKFKKAKPYIQEAINTCEKMNYLPILPTLYQNMGQISMREKKYQDAKQYYRKAINISQKIGRLNLELKSKSSLGWLYLVMVDSLNLPDIRQKVLLEMAKDLNEESFRTANKHGLLIRKQSAAKRLQVINERTGDYKEALKYAKIFKAVSDSLKNEKKDRILAEMEEKYQNENQKLRIEKLEQESILDEKVLQNQRYFLIIMIFGTAFITAFLISYIYRNKQKQKTNKLLKEKNDELNKAYQNLEKMSLALSNSDNAIVVTDKEGKVEWINKGFLDQHNKISDNHFENLKGESLNDNSRYEGIDSIFDHIRENKKSITYENQQENSNGELIESQVTVTPIFENNDISGYVLVETNITPLKQTEKKLKEAVETKDKFLSIIAHDLRNPFNSLLGLSEIYVEDNEDLSREEMIAFIQNVYDVSRQGYDLLQNLLEWSRLQSGNFKLEKTHVNLKGAVSKAKDLLSMNARQKNISLINQVENSYIVLANEYTLMTIFRNLISNAIKFTEPGGYVKIYTKDQNGEVSVFVEDNGTGMTEKQIYEIKKSKTTSTKPGTENEKGIGLGLNLVYEFSKSNGANVDIQSQPGEGSIIKITMARYEKVNQ